MATLEDKKNGLDIRQERSVPLHMTAFGLDLVVYEGAFIPEQLENWRWATECFPPVSGLDVLQVGCGAGLPGLHLANLGARSVTCVDASARAVVNTAENAKRNDIHNLNAFQSDVFSNVSPELRFDIIFWNIPSQLAPLEDGLEREIIDPGHLLLKRFLSEGQQWLKGGGRMMLSFGKDARDDILLNIVRGNQLESSVVVQGSIETHTETFRLIQIRRPDNMGQVCFDQSHALTERARSVYPAGVTRVSIGTVPVRGGNNSISIYAHSGEGAGITDVDGNNYVDFHNNFSTLVHGHRHPRTIAAIASQLQRGTCFGNPTAADVDLAEIIDERVSAIERIRFLNSGTEAVMFAIKASRAMTGRTRLAKLEGAFHGTYDWAEVSTRSEPDNWGESPNSIPPYRSTPPHVTEDVVVLPFNDVERARNIIERHGAELACIIVDMLPCAAGMIPVDESYLTMLQDVAHKHGILLISDEVVCFRLGYHGASAARSFQPDLVTLGKLVGGGLPIGLVGGKKSVMEAFAPQDRAPVPQGGTFSANPLSMAAGHAALAALTAPEIDRINALGCYLRERTEEVAAKSDVAITVQGAGSLFRFHAKRIRPYDYRSGHHDAVEREVLRQLQVGMLERGIYVAAPFWGSISTSMNKAHIDDFLEAFRACLLEIPEIKGFDRRSR
ncbi:aminotransferase class III-fold pyridoxal phosphate-dependent enzyme [Sinorhizobium meliloti]|uniref:aminotransferase class III-fold pyridoxal phosphate-dependent enzyme n=1 Tax=Rhizobium meliloti TaxID=382 RepID=UPI00031A0A68|nr:aminotransferase class III-fold pyridoxal phosphate-dependent enzyme [Sinorhizobium meliloti]MDE3761364.1 aminotransferase class III-fold pyridoxal phosphate-dependent enzyme [Sinorhizobium meliloti]